jgi:hypothetical protein
MTPWWGTLLAALAGGLIAVAGAILNGSFDRRRARGEEWFRRLQWAQQLTASGLDANRAAGFRLLRALGESKLASNDDLLLLYVLTDDHDLDTQAELPESVVDSSVYLVETGDAEREEGQP